MIEKHFVTFVSPGTFVPETTTQEIESWDVAQATEMSQAITERHRAKPYSFHFTTRQNDGKLDSEEVARSCNYFLGGRVLTLAEIKAKNNPADKVLIMNMEGAGYTRVIENRNSYRATLPLNDKDVILNQKESL